LDRLADGENRRGGPGGVIRRCGHIFAFLLLGASLGFSGRVTAIFEFATPVTVRALQRDSAGTVLFWTTFGGSKADYVSAMAIAPDGAISVVGSTASLDYPLTSDATHRFPRAHRPRSSAPLV
jgi:hypothetical protein